MMCSFTVILLFEDTAGKSKFSINFWQIYVHFGLLMIPSKQSKLSQKLKFSFPPSKDHYSWCNFPKIKRGIGGIKIIIIHEEWQNTEKNCQMSMKRNSMLPTNLLSSDRTRSGDNMFMN